VPDLFYYLSGRQTIKLAGVKEAGLAYAVGKGGPTHSPMSLGPDKQSGVVFSFGTAPLHLGKQPKWEQMPNSKIWIGYDPDQKFPGPSELKREQTFGGHEVKLADGNKWIVPVARALDGTTPLPRRLRWDGSEWTPSDVLPQYVDLFDKACALWDGLMAAAVNPEAETGFTFSQECDVAAHALALNYRVGPAEISILGLFDTQSEIEIAKAIVDWPTFEQIKKNMASENVGSTPGGEA